MTLHVLEPPYLELTPAGGWQPGAGAVLVADLASGIPTLASAVQVHRTALWCPLVAALSDRSVPASCLSAFESVPGAFAPLYPGDYPCLGLSARAARPFREREARSRRPRMPVARHHRRARS